MNLRQKHLVSTDWLAQRLFDPKVVIVDMRGIVRTSDLGNGKQTAEYLGNRPAYEAAHIPTAIYIDWTRDIIDGCDSVQVQAAPFDQLEAFFSTVGIGEGVEVVAYDDHPASQFATRLWWLLHTCGFSSVRILDGGWKKWLAEGRQVASGMESRPKKEFTANPRVELRTTADQVLANLGDDGFQLVDARDEAQYSGATARGSRGGRIPGALHLPREALTLASGEFRSDEELAEAFRSAGIEVQEPVTAYCNGGVAATSVLFAYSILGGPLGINYDGSWNEWGERMDLPVEAG